MPPNAKPNSDSSRRAPPSPPGTSSLGNLISEWKSADAICEAIGAAYRLGDSRAMDIRLQDGQQAGEEMENTLGLPEIDQALSKMADYRRAICLKVLAKPAKTVVEAAAKFEVILREFEDLPCTNEPPTPFGAFLQDLKDLAEATASGEIAARR